MLVRLNEELETSGIDLRIVEAHGTQRDILRAEGLEQLCGPIKRRISLADAVAEFTSGRQMESNS
jgi:hypothetical protein